MYKRQILGFLGWFSLLTVFHFISCHPLLYRTRLNPNLRKKKRLPWEATCSEAVMAAAETTKRISFRGCPACWEQVFLSNCIRSPPTIGVCSIELLYVSAMPFRVIQKPTTSLIKINLNRPTLHWNNMETVAQF